jgi:regulator of nucleoside diphosphate kinase
MLFKKKKYMISKSDHERLLKLIGSLNPEETCVKKIKDKLKYSRIIESEEIRPNVITMNTRFRLKNLGNGSRNEFVLVFPEQQNPEKNQISVFDFLGTEVLCHEVGEVIPSANSDCFFLIENIIYQPEAAGDYHL